MGKFEIKAEHSKLFNAVDVSTHVQKHVGSKPRLKCRSDSPDAAGTSDSTPQKILHLVELCYDIKKESVDCPTEG